jgi:inhibitor of KinA sporulation pathway (predicted exonuclease)
MMKGVTEHHGAAFDGGVHHDFTEKARIVQRLFVAVVQFNQ